MNICILKDKKINEMRAPLIPEDISYLKNKFPEINFFIELSKSRIISNNSYYKVGCRKYINQKIDLFLSIEEVALNKINSNQNYMMFFSIAKKQKINISLLKKVLNKDCSLIDYGLLKSKGTETISKKKMSTSSPYESTKYLSSKLKKVLPKILKTINEDSIEDYYLSKKGYLNYRYLYLLNYLIES